MAKISMVVLGLGWAPLMAQEDPSAPRVNWRGQDCESKASLEPGSASGVQIRFSDVFVGVGKQSPWKNFKCLIDIVQDAKEGIQFKRSQVRLFGTLKLPGFFNTTSAQVSVRFAPIGGVPSGFAGSIWKAPRVEDWLLEAPASQEDRSHTWWPCGAEAHWNVWISAVARYVRVPVDHGIGVAPPNTSLDLSLEDEQEGIGLSKLEIPEVEWRKCEK